MKNETMPYEQLQSLITALLKKLAQPQCYNATLQYEALLGESSFLVYTKEDLRHAARLCNALGFLRDFAEYEDGFSANGLTKTGVRMLDKKPLYYPAGGWELLGYVLSAALILIATCICIAIYSNAI